VRLAVLSFLLETGRNGLCSIKALKSPNVQLIKRKTSKQSDMIFIFFLDTAGTRNEVEISNSSVQNLTIVNNYLTPEPRKSLPYILQIK